MKRLPIILLGVAALTFSATGCKNSSQKSGADSLALAGNEDTLAVDSFGYTYANADSSIECTILVDFPRGDDSLSQAVKTFIGKQLHDLYLPYLYIGYEDNEDPNYPSYKGSVLKAQEMIDHYGKYSVKYMKELNEETNAPLCQAVEIRKKEETATYVTYAIDAYANTGGAHGSSTYFAINFSKLTNKPIEKAIDSLQTKAVQGFLERGVKQYLKEIGEKDFTISDLYSFVAPIDEKPSNQIPLPAYTPYIEKDSLCFVYQQYEIAPYALGRISFNVALKDIKPYLRKEVKELIK